MKNKRTKVLYIIFFIAAVFFAAFVLAEFRSDYIAIALAGIVMLIAAYFLVDKIERDIYERYEDDKRFINEKLDDTAQQIARSGNKIDQLQEAILNASLQGLTKPQDKLAELSKSLNDVEQSLTQQETNLVEPNMKNILRTQQETIALIKMGFKTIIQYSKENARQVALNTNQNTEQILTELSASIEKLTEEIPVMIDKSISEVKDQYDSFSDSYLENTSLISQRLEEIQKLSDEISAKLHE